MDTLKSDILQTLKDVGGFIPITPAAKAEKIQKIFQVRKKDFVKAVEDLVNTGDIEITPGGIQVKVASTASGRMFRQIRRKRR